MIGFFEDPVADVEAAVVGVGFRVEARGQIICKLVSLGALGDGE